MADIDVAEHLGWLRKVAARYLGNGVDYDDLVGEGSLALLAAAKTYDASEGSFTNWSQWYIRRRLHWYVVRERRKFGAMRQWPQSEFGQDIDWEAPPDDEQGLSCDECDTLIASLPWPGDHQVVRLRLAGYSYRAIGDMVGLSPQRVHQRNVRANEFMRKRLKDHERTAPNQRRRKRQRAGRPVPDGSRADSEADTVAA